MIALYILAGLLLLLLLPVSARFCFNGKSRLTVRYAGIPVWRFDSEATEKKTKKRATAGPKPTGKNSTLQKLTAELKDGGAGVAVVFSEAAKQLGKLSRRLIRTIHVRRFWVEIAVGGKDASQTAMKYGALCSPVHTARTLLEIQLRTKKIEVDMRPDFCREQDAVAADVRAFVLPLAVLCFGFQTVWSLFWSMTKLSKGRKEVQDG